MEIIEVQRIVWTRIFLEGKVIPFKVAVIEAIEIVTDVRNHIIPLRKDYKGNVRKNVDDIFEMEI